MLRFDDVILNEYHYCLVAMLLQIVYRMCQQNVSVKGYWKSVNIWRRWWTVGHKVGRFFEILYI